MFKFISYLILQFKLKRSERLIKKYGYLLIIDNKRSSPIHFRVLFPGTPFIDIQEKAEVFNNECDN